MDQSGLFDLLDATCFCHCRGELLEFIEYLLRKKCRFVDYVMKRKSASIAR